MLTEAFPKLCEGKFVPCVRLLLRSRAFPALVAVLMACSEIFSLEIYVYWIYLLLIALIVFFGEDTLPLLPILCSCYMTVSGVNNVGKLPGQTVFTDPVFMTQFVFIILIAVALLAGRLVSMLLNGKKKEGAGMAAGLLLLCASFLLAGAAAKIDYARSAVFALVQVGAWACAYFYFRFTVDFKRAPKDYALIVVLSLGLGVAAETVGMYFHPWVDLEHLDRTMLYTGWGIYNNVGGVLVACLPSAFYFSVKHRFGWVFSVLGSVMMLAVLLTQSRAAILFGGFIFVVCAVIVLVTCKGSDLIGHLAVFASLLTGVLVCLIAFKQDLLEMFASLLRAGFISEGRKDIYKECFKKFLAHPIFGVGFYETPGGLLNGGGIADLQPCPPDSFLPPRAHNTFFQLIATGGAFSLAAYLMHRVQTLFLFFRRPTVEKSFIGLCIFALLLASLLDCHIFNFGPAILYSALLAFAEGTREMRRKTLSVSRKK